MCRKLLLILVCVFFGPFLAASQRPDRFDCGLELANEGGLKPDRALRLPYGDRIGAISTDYSADGSMMVLRNSADFSGQDIQDLKRYPFLDYLGESSGLMLVDYVVDLESLSVVGVVLSRYDTRVHLELSPDGSRVAIFRPEQFDVRSTRDWALIASHQFADGEGPDFGFPLFFLDENTLLGFSPERGFMLVGLSGDVQVRPLQQSANEAVLAYDEVSRFGLTPDRKRLIVAALGRQKVRQEVEEFANDEVDDDEIDGGLGEPVDDTKIGIEEKVRSVETRLVIFAVWEDENELERKKTLPIVALPRDREEPIPYSGRVSIDYGGPSAIFIDGFEPGPIHSRRRLSLVDSISLKTEFQTQGEPGMRRAFLAGLRDVSFSAGGNHAIVRWGDESEEEGVQEIEIKLIEDGGLVGTNVAVRFPSDLDAIDYPDAETNETGLFHIVHFGSGNLSSEYRTNYMLIVDGRSSRTVQAIYYHQSPGGLGNLQEVRDHDYDGGLMYINKPLGVVVPPGPSGRFLVFSHVTGYRRGNDFSGMVLHRFTYPANLQDPLPELSDEQQEKLNLKLERQAPSEPGRPTLITVDAVERRQKS